MTGRGVCPGKTSGISLGGGSALLEVCDEQTKRCEHVLISLAKEGGQDVLADAVPPEVISAVTSREAGGVEVDPVRLRASGDAIAPRPKSDRAQREAPLEPVQVHSAGGLEIDGRFGGIWAGKDVRSHTQI
jgi:hypothetical protein